MSLAIVPLEAAHYVEAVGGHAPRGMDAQSIGERYARSGTAVAGFKDGRLLGVAGLIIPWPGLAEGWLVLTDFGRAHGVVCQRLILRHMARLLEEHQIRRLQADVVRRFALGRRWAIALGLRKEATMRAYGLDGEDYTRYVLIRQGARRG